MNGKELLRRGNRKELLRQGFERILAAQQQLAIANVARLRRVNPDKSPEEIIRILTRTYLAAVTAAGAASGAAAVVPGAAVPTALADVMAFTEASALYALSLAEVHGLHPEDNERRKLLVVAVLMGNSGTGALEKALGRTGPHWGKKIVAAIPMRTVNNLNKVLGPRFITKYGTKQGVVVLATQVPIGIGAVLGAGGDFCFARLTVASAKKVFGPPPVAWPSQAPADVTVRAAVPHPAQ